MGDAFITLKAADREDFWAYVEANTVEVPAPPLKRRGTWLRPGLAATVKHLRGEGMLRHASLKGCAMSTSDLPKPGMPKVDYIEPSLQRWTFASDEPEVQEREFWRWLGWFALDEEDKPFERNGRVWLVRKN